MIRADYEKKHESYNEMQKRFYGQTSYCDVMKDNYLRFTVLAFLDRLTVIRQTSLHTSFHSILGKDTLLTNFNLSRGAGMSRGILRGNFLNLIQFTGVHFQALALSDKSPAAFFPLLLVLDSVLHPLDTIKTRWQADTRGLYSSFADCAGRTSPSQLFNGYFFKLAYTAIMGTYFVNLSNDCYCSPLSIALLTAAYPFLTLKSIAQVNNQGTVFSDFTSVFKGIEGNRTSFIRTAYRGFLPFLTLNLLAPYTFPQLWSKTKREHELEKADEKWQETVAVIKGHH